MLNTLLSKVIFQVQNRHSVHPKICWVVVIKTRANKRVNVLGRSERNHFEGFPFGGTFLSFSRRDFLIPLSVFHPCHRGKHIQRKYSSGAASGGAPPRSRACQNFQFSIIDSDSAKSAGYRLDGGLTSESSPRGADPLSNISLPSRWLRKLLRCRGILSSLAGGPNSIYLKERFNCIFERDSAPLPS